MNFLKKYFGLLIVLALSFWVIRSLLISGFFPMHDDTQVARVYEMGKMLKLGVFPVRWVPDLGYGFGYPIFNFYAPLAYYFGGFFVLLGFDALISTKIMMVLGILAAGIFMYLLAREFFGELGGVVSALFYLYAPYHAVQVFVRGDVAEFWAYAFIPLAFLGIYKKNILIGSLGFAAIILSHNLTAMMATPFLLIIILLYCYIAFKEKKSFIIVQLLLVFILGLAISAFFWIPALAQMKSTNVLSQIGGGADFRSHFVCLSQFWESVWGFGGSIPGCVDGFSFKIGKIHIISSFAAFLLAAIIIRKDKNRKLIIFSFLGFIASAFLMIEASRSIWESISLMAFFQYPWRFLILASFFSSFLAGYLIYLLKQMGVRIYFPTLFLVLILLVFNIKLFSPATILQKEVADYTNEEYLKWTASKISDEYLSPDFKKPESLKDVNRDVPKMPRETAIEKVSNWLSMVGLLALTIVIIFKRKKL